MALLIGLLCISSCSSDKGTEVIISCEYGDMTFTLYEDTPKHRDNFIKLVKENFYDGLCFHRVMKNFMVQGGDPNSKEGAPNRSWGSGGPGYTLPPEIGHKHFKGALSTARLPDGVNPEKESNGSQFFIVHGIAVDEAMLKQLEQQKSIQYSQEDKVTYADYGGYPFLDGDYTVFGQMTSGFEVLDKLVEVPVNGQMAKERHEMKITIK